MHRPEYIREATPEMKDFLCDNADVITKLTIAAENPTVQYIPDFVKAGIIVSIGHSNATYEVAKAAFHKRGQPLRHTCIMRCRRSVQDV